MKNQLIRDVKRAEDSREAAPRGCASEAEMALFLGRWLKAPHRIGALAPSSRYLAQAMAREIDPRQARLVVELGGGTGSITRALLAAGLAPERLIVVERDERLHRLLAKRFPELRVIAGDAAQLGALLRPLGITSVSAIVSSLPLLSMPKRLRQRIVEQSFALLDGRGSLVQFTYGLASPLPARDFAVSGRVVARVWRNFPPACVWRFEGRAAAMAEVA
ncbi:MAG TPA: phospholipid methyltransferase [Stellaceae bacterium]|nr:phospholipid methyltransferase [Stellaceae bacterium]